MKKVIFFFISYCCIFLISTQLVISQTNQLYINEFMASNATAIYDEAGQYDDWIEIYNAESADVSLQGFYLTDDLKNPKKWAFPNIEIPARGYLLIWADNDLNQSGLHASFKLSQDGEQIGLYNGSAFVDQITYGAQSTDISFGRKQDGAATWVFFQVPNNPPTPGSMNVYNFISGLNPPSFYPNEGFYQGSISVQLSSKDNASVICYTMDGSHPTTSSMQYSSPITITVSTTIRAIAYKATPTGDTLVSNIVTGCYLLNIDNSMPLLDIVCDPGDHNKIYNSAVPDEDRPAIQALYKYFDSDHFLQGDLPITLSIRGGYSVISPKKSYQVTFSDKNFSYDLFDQEYNYPRIQNFPTTFHSFNLNGMAADYSLVRNYLAFRLLQNAGAEAPQVAFTRLFVNGDDRGIYFPMERIDKWFVKSRNFAPGDYDIIKTGTSHNCSLTLDNENGAYFELKEGDFNAFNNFLNWLNSDDHDFQELAEKIDIASFLYYDLMCRFSNNKDSYDINYYLIKNRDIATSKWKILYWDSDESFGWDSHPNGYWYPYNKAFDQLRQTDDYNFLFRNTLADLINTKWSLAEVSKLVKNMEDQFQADNPSDELIWNEEWYEYADGAIPDFAADPNYNPLSRYSQFDYIKGWVGERIDYLHNQTWEPDTALLIISPPIGGKGSIQLNSLLLTAFPWSGAYFKEIPIPISAIPDPGYYFVGWSDSTLPQQPEIMLVLHNDYQLTAIFQPDSLHYEIVINEINYNSSNQFDPGDWIELYNPNKDTVDLSGWHLKDDALDHDFQFPAGTIIVPNEFLIVCQKKRDFHSLFPVVTNYIGDMNFGLSSESDEIRIFNPLLDLIDSVRYDENHPWPGEANGSGATLELLDKNLDNTIAGNWQASAGYGSPGKATLALPVVTRLVAMDSSGSALVTHSRDVLIEIEGNDFDGHIVKWLISESNTLPEIHDFVLTSQPDHYQIHGNEGNVTLFGWALDNDNQISRLTDTSRANILLVLRSDRFSISGKATYLQNQHAIADLEVQLTESNIVIKDTTDGLGSFYFTNLYPGTVRLETIKTGDWRHAISGVDALLILYDLANMFKLSRNSMLAADATEDGKITEADAQAILRFLTLDPENNGGAGKWCAIPRDTTYLLNANALSNFQCYLLGDVNLDWDLHGAPGNDSLNARDSIDIIVQSYDVTVNDKQFVKVPIVLRPKNESIHSLLFSLEYDPQV
ncbi:CotH kinase family protein, partial [candidate division KSB1 bacterium]|nr:CotH kinase family protein [candidate division KSB1 bacterium]